MSRLWPSALALPVLAALVAALPARQWTGTALQQTGCGSLGALACSYFNDTSGYTVHWCSSEGNWTITVGAVPHTDGTFTCEICGTPDGPACECTHDNDPNVADRYRLPCDDGLHHWCRFQPQYIAEQSAADGLFYCVHNITDSDSEGKCGLEGEQACLDSVTGIYSCVSPDANGTVINAVQHGDDELRRRDPQAPFLCVRCGVQGGLACDGTTCEDPETLHVIEVEGQLFCATWEEEEPTANLISGPPAPPPSPGPPPLPPVTSRRRRGLRRYGAF